MNRTAVFMLTTTVFMLLLSAGTIGAQDATETPDAAASTIGGQEMTETPDATAEATTVPAMHASPLFYSMTVTVRGNYGNLINARAFDMTGVNGMFQTPGVLVIDMTGEGLNFGQYATATDNGLLVMGRLEQYAVVAQYLEETQSEEHTSELQSPCNLVCR